MFDPDSLSTLFSAVPPALMTPVMAVFMEERPTEERTAAVENLLRACGDTWRQEIGEWIADLLSVEKLVPETYANWRPLIHRSMAFVASHISNERLAPKIVQQIELPPDTPAEIRLGLVIAKTPGLQKLGQVLARTRRLSPSLREELQKLENSISDVTPEEVHEIVVRQLTPCIDAYQVQLAPELLCEASVSAILKFTWFNPTSGKREAGVFKVIKPHVPECYAEDLKLLRDLAEHLAAGGREYEFASREVADTLDEVCLLLAREVDFRKEQATLAEVGRVYRHKGAHAPKPIPELCSDTITAMSFERGVKVTDACRARPLFRRHIASQIVGALIADPMFSSEDDAVFHADPHAGNMLYDAAKKELIVLDWALTTRLSREQRRQLALLMIKMTFRDVAGVRSAIYALASEANGSDQSHTQIVDRCVKAYFEALPLACSLGALDAMRLLEQIGIEGVRFPGSLVLIRKSMFTLDGVLRDVVGDDVRIDTIVAGEFMSRWFKRAGSLPSPFSLADYFAVQRSALFYASGLWSLSA